jgi:hypothetical protein
MLDCPHTQDSHPRTATKMLSHRDHKPETSHPCSHPGQAPKMHLQNHKIAPLTDEEHGEGEHEGEHETPV